MLFEVDKHVVVLFGEMAIKLHPVYLPINNQLSFQFTSSLNVMNLCSATIIETHILIVLFSIDGLETDYTYCETWFCLK